MSHWFGLRAADVVPAGIRRAVGLCHERPLWLTTEDRIEVEVEGTGILVNDVVDERS